MCTRAEGRGAVVGQCWSTVVGRLRASASLSFRRKLARPRGRLAPEAGPMNRCIQSLTHRTTHKPFICSVACSRHTSLDLRPGTSRAAVISRLHYGLRRTAHLSSETRATHVTVRYPRHGLFPFVRTGTYGRSHSRLLGSLWAEAPTRWGISSYRKGGGAYGGALVSKLETGRDALGDAIRVHRRISPSSI